MPAASIPIGVGSLVGGRYRLERLLGQGAGGSVWQATHETIGRAVAIKFLAKNHRRAAIRFLQEARLAAQVQHRHVVSIFDFGNLADGTLYMVMERLHGETLGARLGRTPALPVRELLRLSRQALAGLQAVHQHGIVHRDLKPENIFLVEESGEVFAKLLDFGVSRGGDAGVLGPEMSKLTATGMTVGTPLYMAPEQARGKRELDARADVYSMGVILFRALSGRSPYRESNVLDLMMAVVNSTEAPPLHAHRADLGRPLSDLVQRAMAPDREQRFPDAASLARALEVLEVQISPAAVCPVKERRAQEERVVPPEPDEQAAGEISEPTLPLQVLDEAQLRRRRRARLALGAGGMTAAGLLGLLALVLGRGPGEPAATRAAAGAGTAARVTQATDPLTLGQVPASPPPAVIPDALEPGPGGLPRPSRPESAGGAGGDSRAIGASPSGAVGSTPVARKPGGTSRPEPARGAARKLARPAPAIFTQPDF